MKETKHVICTGCDNICGLQVEMDGQKIVSMQGFPDPRAICQKAEFIEDITNHPQRLMHPLKNVGKRGEQKWERISWDQALDEIAEKLTKSIETYGGESMAATTLPLNAGGDQGLLRRFMNHLGSPNWITGLHMCVGNTAQVHRATQGWFSIADYTNTDLVVYHGHFPTKQKWVAEYYQLKDAMERGAKLIVMDPRKSWTAKEAEVHLPLRYGTDAAMLMGWLNVIINEELYDKDFVKNMTVGFEELKERVQDYPVEKVAEITECDPEMIRKAARMYAKADFAIIPWGVVPDMQKNSTSVLRCQSILRAICGFLNKSELIGFNHPDVVSISEMEMHEIIPEEKKKLQLGTEKYPLFTYEGLKSLNEPAKRVYGREYCNVQASFMANPPNVFEAMRTGKPYPVKSLFVTGSNPLMGYANQQGIYEGLMNLDLLVVIDHLLTPTAQLADYVLPGDAWPERPVLGPFSDSFPMIFCSQKLMDPPGECKNLFDLINGLAHRMGLEEHFPFETIEDVFDYRLKNTGMKWDEYKKEYIHMPSEWFDPLTSGTGMATPSGKIELYSSLLEELGYDPLPYYKEPEQTRISAPELAKEYPLDLFIGLREHPYYQTNLRHVERLRKQVPDPLTLINPADCELYGVDDGDWVWVATTHGKVKMKVKKDKVQPAGTIRIPHGWWMAELKPGPETGFSGAMLYNDGMLLSDEDWNLDVEQGLPNLRGGLLAKVYPVEE